MPKKLILIIGSPGAGKSTDCELIRKKHAEDISSISVSALIKEEIANGSALGKIMNGYALSGDLIPGEIIMYEVFGLIKNAPKNIVLMDGLPRGLNQMKSLGDALFNNKEIKLVSVIEIRVSKEVARKRVLSDNPSKEEETLFEHKMEVYSDLIKEIENYYKKDNLLTIIDGEQDAQTVADEIDEFLKTKISLFG